jgi:hypothetical protein
MVHMQKFTGADGNSNHLGYTKHPYAKDPYPKKAKKIKLWLRTICSYCVSRLDRHVTYYTSPHVYIQYVDTRLSLPSLKYTVVAWLLKVGTNENGSACGRWLSIGI